MQLGYSGFVGTLNRDGLTASVHIDDFFARFSVRRFPFLLSFRFPFFSSTESFRCRIELLSGLRLFFSCGSCAFPLAYMAMRRVVAAQTKKKPQPKPNPPKKKTPNHQTHQKNPKKITKQTTWGVGGLGVGAGGRWRVGGAGEGGVFFWSFGGLVCLWGGGGGGGVGGASGGRGGGSGLVGVGVVFLGGVLGGWGWGRGGWGGCGLGSPQKTPPPNKNNPPHKPPTKPNQPQKKIPTTGGVFCGGGGGFVFLGSMSSTPTAPD